MSYSSDYIDFFKEEDCIALFYEGSYAGIGWTLFESEYQLLEWAYHAISDDVLGDRQYWPNYDDIKGLSKILDDEQTPILDRVQKFLKSYEELTYRSTISASHKLLTYDQFIKDKDFQEEFKEFLQEEGHPDCSMEENHALVAEMIIPRWGEPSAW